LQRFNVRGLVKARAVMFTGSQIKPRLTRAWPTMAVLSSPTVNPMRRAAWRCLLLKGGPALQAARLLGRRPWSEMLIAHGGLRHRACGGVVDERRPLPSHTQYNPTKKNCQQLYASRRLATEANWEPAKQVRAAPTMTTQDHFARIHVRGDVVLVFPGFYSDDSSLASSSLAIRHALDR
jgi:hypothetical protein